MKPREVLAFPVPGTTEAARSDAPDTHALAYGT
jgi:hypothetical protein